MFDFPGGIALPEPSRAKRDIASKSKGHCTAYAVLGDDNGAVVQAESWTELRCLVALNARREVVEIEEQVNFHFGWNGESLHVFDMIGYFRDGSKLAYTVKPEERLTSGSFLAQMREVAWWVREVGFADGVRLLTERTFSKAEISNAMMMSAVREADPEADDAAAAIVSSLWEERSLRDLTLELRLGQRGYRALIRQMRLGRLVLLAPQLITPKSLVTRPDLLARLA